MAGPLGARTGSQERSLEKGFLGHLGGYTHAGKGRWKGREGGTCGSPEQAVSRPGTNTSRLKVLTSGKGQKGLLTAGQKSFMQCLWSSREAKRTSKTFCGTRPAGPLGVKEPGPWEGASALHLPGPVTRARQVTTQSPCCVLRLMDMFVSNPWSWTRPDSTDQEET